MGSYVMNDYIIRILQQYIGQKFKIIPIIMNYQNTRKRSIFIYY
jgi:predicted class III extradiol MEMO1 family dioxygenase